VYLNVDFIYCASVLQYFTLLTYCMMQEMYGEENSPEMFMSRQNRENSEELIEIGSLSSSDDVTRTVTKQVFTGHLDHRRTPVDHTSMDSPHNPYSGTPLSAGSLSEASQMERNESGRWSSAVEISSTTSHEKCSSRSLQSTVPASPTCTSISSRSETYDDLSEKHFRQNPANSPGSPPSGFCGSLKNRLLQRSGAFCDEQINRDLWDSQNTGGKESAEVYADDLPLSSQVLRDPPMSGAGIHISRSSPNSKDLTESQAASSQCVGLYEEKSSLDSQYLADSRTTQAVPSRFTYLPTPSSANQSVYPTLYRPSLVYHEAAATAALFYNQLAAVHHLQQQQRLFLGAQNQLTMTSEGHAHSSLNAQSESMGPLRIQQADQAKLIQSVSDIIT